MTHVSTDLRGIKLTTHASTRGMHCSYCSCLVNLSDPLAGHDASCIWMKANFDATEYALTPARLHADDPPINNDSVCRACGLNVEDSPKHRDSHALTCPWRIANEFKQGLLPSDKPGVKADHGKDRWDLLPWDAVEGVVRVLTFGAKKYAPWNWVKVPDARNRYLSAAMRHIVKWVRGERIDADSGESHLSCAICCLLFLESLDAAGKLPPEEQL